MTRTKKLTFALLVALPLFAIGAGQHEHHDHVAHAKSQPIKIELDNGKKWPTDAPLRKGMNTIREVTAATIASMYAGTATDATYAAAANRIDRQISNIIQNCKLDPAADAQLHVLISEMMASSGVMAGKAPAKPRMDGLHRMAEALDAYGTHFTHPSWKGLEIQQH
ncbi:hypothetical protein NX773_12945 [Massilia solisilvae]|uniref:DnrO protein n=1 Tax=Massilia solisilvae TaxID=1811225 RepID=A0ABT2BKM8_9BURK|nr:hypothetical protein [Massilia solisilvae]MCS0609071.1 hypothetical protein [Massilia solisilvae]